jgi:hypothetical protein
VQPREVAERLDAGEEEVGAPPDGGEGRQPGDPPPDRALRDLEFQGAVLVADDRVALVAGFVEGKLVLTVRGLPKERTGAG